MSYYKPNTVIVDGKMIVPQEQQKEFEDCKKKKIRLFSYKQASKSVFDMNIDLNKNTIPALKDLAMVLGINTNKLKKQELVDLLKPQIVFE